MIRLLLACLLAVALGLTLREILEDEELVERYRRTQGGR